MAVQRVDDNGDSWGRHDEGKGGLESLGKPQETMTTGRPDAVFIRRKELPRKSCDVEPPPGSPRPVGLRCLILPIR